MSDTTMMDDLGLSQISTESSDPSPVSSKRKFGSKKLRRTLKIKVRQCLICGAMTRHKKRNLVPDDEFNNETYEWTSWDPNHSKCQETSEHESSSSPSSPQSLATTDARTSSEISSDEGISSGGDGEMSDDEQYTRDLKVPEYTKDTTPLNENSKGFEGRLVGVVQQVISAGFSSLVCI